ncbi:MAG TPA: alpha-amylase family glycosyl hydrolase [Fulvivirga sp.]|nr:alpha-amylase family glycosyl hydrolase [Fulvivirga sp.]
MKKLSIYFILLFAVSTLSCNQQTKENALTDVNEVKYPEKAKNMNIYEVNIRQYTPEGTINAFSTHLPRLKKMGVDILWIMPVQPIGVKNRKGPLGSYYSIQDYTAVNPHFGTIDDFKTMVKQAHDLGMAVILDWVGNHSSFDHEWTKNTGYYNTDSLGNITWPAGTDWTDVADLNYDNAEMQQDMINEMKWWVTETDIDGFRCDVAGEVPMEFWNNAKDQLDSLKDLFMLAEWDEPRMHDHAFHMTYGWGPHHWMNETAKGHIDVDSLESLLIGDIDRYGKAPFRMLFTTNHDENSWNGTVFERFGEGHLAWAVFAFTVRGMPLIYGGQEAGLNKRLRFFDKDTIDFSQLPYAEFYGKLLALKHNNEALFNGEYGGDLNFINDGNNEVTTYTRTKDENEVLVIINLSDKVQEVSYSDAALVGDYTDYLSGELFSINPNEKLTLQPYQYHIVSK